MRSQIVVIENADFEYGIVRTNTEVCDGDDGEELGHEVALTATTEVIEERENGESRTRYTKRHLRPDHEEGENGQNGAQDFEERRPDLTLPVPLHSGRVYGIAQCVPQTGFQGSAGKGFRVPAGKTGLILGHVLPADDFVNQDTPLDMSSMMELAGFQDVAVQSDQIVFVVCDCAPGTTAILLILVFL